MKPVEPKPPRHPKEPIVRAAFARMLVQFRESAQLTQAEVAEKSGYAEKYIGFLEQRKHTPTLTALIEISKAVKSSPAEMLTGILALMPSFAHLEGKPGKVIPSKRR